MHEHHAGFGPQDRTQERNNMIRNRTQQGLCDVTFIHCCEQSRTLPKRFSSRNPKQMALLSPRTLTLLGSRPGDLHFLKTYTWPQRSSTEAALCTALVRMPLFGAELCFTALTCPNQQSPECSPSARVLQSSRTLGRHLFNWIMLYHTLWLVYRHEGKGHVCFVH